MATALKDDGTPDIVRLNVDVTKWMEGLLILQYEEARSYSEVAACDNTRFIALSEFQALYYTYQIHSGPRLKTPLGMTSSRYFVLVLAQYKYLSTSSDPLRTTQLRTQFCGANS